MGDKVALHIDGVLRRVLGFTLNPATATESVLFLEQAVQEFRADGNPPPEPVLLSAEWVDRSVVSYLTTPPPGTRQWPVFYLIGAWGRGSDELRGSIPTALREPVQAVLRLTKELLASYTALVLLGFFLPEGAQPPAAEARGPLQLLDALDKRRPDQVIDPIPESSIAGGVVPLPAGFFEELALTDVLSEPEQMDAVVHPIVETVSKRYLRVNPMGNWLNPLMIIMELRSIKPIADSIVRCPSWLLPGQHGRTIQVESLWGLPMMLSVVTDAPLVNLNLRNQFAGASLRALSAETRRTIDSLRMVQTSIQGQQFEFVNQLLRNKDTREHMIAWIARAVDTNAQERGKMHMNPANAASDGFFINLSALLLRLCVPFIDPESKPARTSLDPRYVLLNKRLNLKEDTKLAADSEEQAAWLERVASGGEATTPTPPVFGFTSDCFFLTSKTLNIGLVKAFQHLNELARAANSLEEQVRDAEARMDTYPPHLIELARRQISQMQRVCKEKTEDYFLLSTAILDDSLLRSALSFYRLQAAWMLRMASPAYAAPVGPGQLPPQPELPLPTPAPMTFRLLPEYMVTDMLELLLAVSRMAPHVFSSLMRHELEEYMMFIVVFLASPEYVHNPYVRSRMAEVLRYWLPEAEEGFQRSRRGAVASLVLQDLIDTQQLAQTHLVRSLLTLYSDIEHTGRNQAFYEKFGCRMTISEILDYLWKVPVHHERWKQIAAQESGEDALYGRFVHHLETDAIWLLNDALDLLPQVRDAEKKLEEEDASMNQQQRMELMQTTERQGEMLRSDLGLAYMTFHIIGITTEEITATWLSPAMASRIAATLNYFLRHITGPDRKKLKVKNPEKYAWRPRELLSQIAKIYVNLYRADRNAIAEAVASEQRSYNDSMFDAAIEVLHQSQSVDEGILKDLADLAVLVAARKEVMAQEAAVEEDAPEEFTDALMGTLMSDPVMLPDSKQVVDRATIQRHLLSNPNDPFTRATLSLDMVLPIPDLKAKIDAWRTNQR